MTKLKFPIIFATSIALVLALANSGLAYRGSGRVDEDRENKKSELNLVCNEGEIVFCYLRPAGTKTCSCKVLYTA
jgi:hypothetical protein